MSYALRARIFADQELTTSEKLVLIALAHHLNDKTGQCDPSLDLQRSECGLSERGLLNILERLEQRRKIAVERGGGRAKRSNYVLYPDEKTLNVLQCLEGNEDEETLKPLQGIEEKTLKYIPENTEAASGFIDRNTERTSGFEPVNPEVRSNASYERRIYSSSSSSARVPAREDSPPTVDALTQALCDACALMPDALGEKQRGQLAEMREWLGSVYADPGTAACEVAARYSPDVWDKPKPPHLPQIRTDWKRMERIVQHKNQQNQPQDDHATDSSYRANGPAPRPSRREPTQNDFQRNAADRRAARAELAAKYAPRPE